MAGEVSATLEWGDWLLVGIYFVITLGVGLWASIKGDQGNARGYFLAGRSMTWIPIGASTFATNIGAPMFVGLAGSAAASGFAVTFFEWHAAFMLILLGWLFLPVYLASGIYTLPEFLRKRFGGKRLRIFLAIIQILLTIVASISGQIYAGTLFIQQIFKIDMYLAVVIILAITAFYTVAGGLTAVIWTDTLQTVILLIGSAVLFVISIVKVGGYEALMFKYKTAAANYTINDYALYGNRTCGLPREDSFHMFRAPESDFPWPGMIFGLTILALRAWCVDQTCVQRSLSAKTLTHAKAGMILAAYLKLLPFFMFIIPGMISRVLYPDEIACADPDHCREVCGNPSGCTNVAYPFLVTRILPTGVRGLMLAALIAALMSSLTSLFSSSSTMFTMDLWRRFRKRPKEAELMLVGRLFTLFQAGLSVAWLPILQAVQGSQFWNYAQRIYSYVSPPWVMVFLIGMFWTGATEQGAFWGLVFGLLVGFIRLALDFSHASPPCGSNAVDTRPDIISKVHYLHFAMIASAVSAIVIVGISLLTKPRPPEKLRKVTFWTRNDPLEPELTDDSADEEDETIEVDPDAEPPSVPRKVYNWICGVQTNPPPVLTEEEKLQLRIEATSIKEDPFWKNVVDINCIICLTIVIFICGFYA
ncbi:unnamed protein product [Owenia fusiformis]|uniref:Uncharacterized protein n=1 Tax=Owenia fusiformis TaxID=6347 RepID=A0A8J1XKG8_OWEFU|nr:unnamed protein product [Owenia fusiformis]